MSKRVQLRRGTASENSSFTGAVGEVTVDTTNKTLRVHDGTTSGGTTLATVHQLPPIATTTYVGVIRIATQTEVNAGWDDTKAVVPNTLLGGMKTHLNAQGTAPIYACRAWVNFNGTGTVAIRSSGNVSSITDNGVGDYTINFTTAMQDINYSAAISGNSVANGTNFTYLTEHSVGSSLSRTTSSIRVGSTASGGGAGGATDHLTANISIFR